MKASLKFLDLFAGGGGLSEGFIRAGFLPVAHVEKSQAACFTLKTRMAYHWLKKNNRAHEYNDYLSCRISREQLYSRVPDNRVASVINAEIGPTTLAEIFSSIDALLKGNSLDLIIGGPPCQAYSVVGRSRDKNRMRSDKRNFLYVYYAEFLKKYQPRYFVFENVLGLLSAKSPSGTLYLDRMRELFRENGYETEYRVLAADEYGVLQHRERIILVGKKGKQTGFYPDPEKWCHNVTVQEVLKDLPSLSAGQGTVLPCKLKKYAGRYLYDAGIRNDDMPVTWHWTRPHTEQDLKIYKIAITKWNKSRERLRYNDLPEDLKTHKNHIDFLDRFKVVAADLPCAHTIVAHISKDGHYYIHPDIEQRRSLTPREVARLQTFPDDYYFESVTGIPARTPAFQQIGNAVPVLLAHKIAKRLMEVW